MGAGNLEDMEDYDPLAVFEAEARSLVRKALDDLGTAIELSMDIPQNQMADIAFPCFPAARELKRSPGDIALAIVEKIGDTRIFEKVESTGPYVNFFFNNTRLTTSTLELISRKKNEYGHLPPTGEKMILEHTSANPTGPLHVGRARNPIIGDTMARIFRKRGYDLDVQFYVDDMGKQLVILTWGHENIPDMGVDDLRADLKFVRYYQEANKMMEDDPSILDQINHLITIYEEGEPDISGKVRRNCEAILDGMLTSMRRLDVHYDSFAWESKYVRDGSVKEVIEKLRASEFTGDDNGALYLDLEEFGIHGRENKLFLTRSDGTSLYTTRDIAYHIEKLASSNIAINVLGEDHKLKAEAVNLCLKIMGHGKGAKGQEDPVEVIFYAFVSLPEGKMSTRRGQVVYVDDLIEEAVSRAREEVERRRPELPDEIKCGIAEIVGIGAIRYNIIRVQAEKKMVFKWEEAMNFEGNSAPFIQYSHARASSILRSMNAPDDTNSKQGDVKLETYPKLSLLTHDSEINLIKALARFPSLIRKCADDRTPHHVASYAHELASLFNQFYRDCPVLSADGELRQARMVLVRCSKIVLQNTLDTLGIVAPEEM